MEFQVLGPVAVEDEHGVVAPGPPRVRAVLGILLARAGTLVSIDQLVDELWPDSPPDHARTLVHSYVSRLRVALRRGAGPAAAKRLVTRKPGYLLEVAGPELDLHRFEELVAAARANQAPDRVAMFRRALRLWRGAPFADVPHTPTIAAAVARLSELRVTTLEELYDAALDAREDADLVGELSELVATHPLRERLVGQLMLALHYAGRSADALATYRQAKQRLADELGIEPGQELAQLELTVLREPAPTDPRHPRPAQLPTDLATFTGRDAELAYLRDLPALPGTGPAAVVISAIDGMAGIGKTALAIRAAHLVADHYPDGQLFLDLHGHTQGIDPVDPADALDRLLRALGTPGDQVPADLPARAALYRSLLAGRRMLILLDNAYGEAQVEPLLPAAPQCLVLVTSRNRLTSLHDAHLISLDVLPLPDAVALFTRTTGRADALTTEIVELCGRLPLAIRIAAARLRHRRAWTVAHLIERLRNHTRRLAELEAGHHSVAAAIDVSYQHLTQDQQRLFRLLGLHPGADLDAYAAAALTDSSAERTTRLLEDLLDAHLIQQHQPGRYQFHDLVRAHAAATCASQEPERQRRAAVTRLLDHYAHTAAAAMRLRHPNEADQLTDFPAPDTPSPTLGDDEQAAVWLDAEQANLLAAAGHAARHDWPAHIMYLSVVLHHHLRTRGRYTEAEALHTHALRTARRVGDRTNEMRALNCLGHMHRMQDKQDVAAFTEALRIAREIGEAPGELSALYGLGIAHRAQGRYEHAAESHQQALELARTMGDQAGELRALYGLGAVHRVLGRHEPARDRFEEALRLARRIGDRVGEFNSLNALGVVYRVREEYDSARVRFEEGLELARHIGHRSGELYSLVGLGVVHRMQGRYDSAEDNHRLALELARAIGDHNAQLEALVGLGHTHQLTGEPGTALADHAAALDIAGRLDQPEDQIRAHHGLARSHQALGDLQQARHHWERALSMLGDLGLTEIEEVRADDVRANLTAVSRGRQSDRQGS